MSFKSIIAQKSFWRSVVFLGIGFLVVYNIINMLFSYGGFDFGSFVRDNFQGGRWLRFAIAQILSGFLYGFILSYGQFRIREKKSQNK